MFEAVDHNQTHWLMGEPKHYAMLLLKPRTSILYKRITKIPCSSTFGDAILQILNLLKVHHDCETKIWAGQRGTPQGCGVTREVRIDRITGSVSCTGYFFKIALKEFWDVVWRIINIYWPNIKAIWSKESTFFYEIFKLMSNWQPDFFIEAHVELEKLILSFHVRWNFTKAILCGWSIRIRTRSWTTFSSGTF